jgi:3'(2'), 5'-bisphosphate nucleotidase
MTKELTFSFELLRELKKLRDSYSADSVSKKQKDDGTPVTELDQKLNDLIVQSLHKSFPEDSIIAEELVDAIDKNSPRTWFIDPLDGTKEFIKGLPEWSVHIGLIENGNVIFGVVGALDLDKIYYAHAGKGAFVANLKNENPKPIFCHRISKIADLRVVTSRSQTDERVDEFIRKNQITSQEPLGSMGLKLCAIAEGSRDIYLNYRGNCGLWDTCAPEVILKEAQGHLSYMNGENVNYSEKKDFRLKYGFVACSEQSWKLLKNANAL